MKNDDFRLYRYTGLRLWVARLREMRHVRRMIRQAERASRPVVMIGNLKIGMP